MKWIVLKFPSRSATVVILSSKKGCHWENSEPWILGKRLYDEVFFYKWDSRSCKKIIWLGITGWTEMACFRMILWRYIKSRSKRHLDALGTTGKKKLRWKTKNVNRLSCPHSWCRNLTGCLQNISTVPKKFWISKPSMIIVLVTVLIVHKKICEKIEFNTDNPIEKNLGSWIPFEGGKLTYRI